MAAATSHAARCIAGVWLEYLLSAFEARQSTLISLVSRFPGPIRSVSNVSIGLLSARQLQ